METNCMIIRFNYKSLEAIVCDSARVFVYVHMHV